MNLLRIDSSVRIKNSKTRSLTDFFIHELHQHSNFTLTTRDVGITPPPFPTDEFIKANYTIETERTAEMNSILKPSDILIEELFAANAIVIASPMYNFSISATLKAYIDTIVRVNKTFTITEDGVLKGLLSGKKVLIITSRGAMSYQKGAVLHTLDFQENYLKGILTFLGITDITFIHTEAQDFGSNELKNENLTVSKQSLLKLAKKW